MGLKASIFYLNLQSTPFGEPLVTNVARRGIVGSCNHIRPAGLTRPYYSSP